MGNTQRHICDVANGKRKSAYGFIWRWINLKELILMDLERQIKIKDEYCQLIINLGFDYDGFNTVDSLKGLIDELVSYAKRAIECDDKEAIYVNGKGERDNILGEPID